jgi:putative protein-disulfide isomerase
MSKLYYIHDPMCSWCWGFSTAWQQLCARLPSHVEVIRLLGGLAQDTATPMPLPMQHKIADTWRQITTRIPGVEFNFNFWKTANPRRSTYPACRAVIAARQQGGDYDVAMTQAIQRAYYLQARNPSEEPTLLALAGELGLDTTVFVHALHHPQTQAELLEEIAEARNMGADSFPSLVLEHNAGFWQIPIDYIDDRPMLEMMQDIMAGEENLEGSTHD